MGGCATKPGKPQAADTVEAGGADGGEEEDVMVEVVKKVVEVEAKEIVGGRKSLSLLFMENKKEKMEDEAGEFDERVEVKAAQGKQEELKLAQPLAASQEVNIASGNGDESVKAL
uniref:Uncharacterized protein n=1 Tax=Kalanchoe fedtschenkoi TaxID=63787 RepID=A0A7N0TA03_KALFE